MREELITGTSNWHWNMGRERITGTGNRYWDKGTKDRGLFKPQGNSEKVSEARKMFTWIVVGAFVLLGVYVIKAAICGSIEQLGITDACKLTEQTNTPKN